MSDTTTPARITVTHSGDGTTADVRDGKDDTGARAALKAAGFRWSSNLGAWFLPRPWNLATRAVRVRQLVAALPGAVVVEDQGAAPSTTAAERDAARPAAGPLARLRRIERNEAEHRRMVRELDAVVRAGIALDSAGYLRRKAEADRLAEEIAHDRAEVERSGIRQYEASDIKPGDLVKYRRDVRLVERVNRKTVSVKTGYTWTDKIELHQITAVYRPTGTPGERLSDVLVEPASLLAALAAEPEPAAAAEDLPPIEERSDVFAKELVRRQATTGVYRDEDPATDGGHFLADPTGGGTWHAGAEPAADREPALF